MGRPGRESGGDALTAGESLALLSQRKQVVCGHREALIAAAGDRAELRHCPFSSLHLAGEGEERAGEGALGGALLTVKVPENRQRETPLYVDGW